MIKISAPSPLSELRASLEIAWANNFDEVEEVVACDIFHPLTNFWNHILSDPNTLADELEKNAGRLNWGTPGKIKEWIKNQTGNQDYLSMLRTRASEITNKMILEAIPKGGNVSDKDVMFAKEGFVDAKASFIHALFFDHW